MVNTAGDGTLTTAYPPSTSTGIPAEEWKRLCEFIRDQASLVQNQASTLKQHQSLLASQTAKIQELSDVVTHLQEPVTPEDIDHEEIVPHGENDGEEDENAHHHADDEMNITVDGTFYGKL